MICGLGGNGGLLAIRCHELGMPVVVIESDSRNEHIVQCRQRGVIIMIGDARDPQMLIQAGVRKASYVVAVSGNDGVNVEIAVRVR